MADDLDIQVDDTKVDCDKHGVTIWRGHVICGACRRVYQTFEAAAPRYAPPDCVCGAHLMPPDDWDTSETYDDDYENNLSACALCWRCFKHVVKKFDGQLPPPATAKA